MNKINYDCEGFLKKELTLNDKYGIAPMGSMVHLEDAFIEDGKPFIAITLPNGEIYECGFLTAEPVKSRKELKKFVEIIFERTDGLLRKGVQVTSFYKSGEAPNSFILNDDFLFKKKPLKKIQPKGTNSFKFDKNGQIIKDDRADVFFECYAINLKNAKRKFEKYKNNYLCDYVRIIIEPTFRTDLWDFK